MTLPTQHNTKTETQQREKKDGFQNVLTKQTTHQILTWSPVMSMYQPKSRKELRQAVKNYYTKNDRSHGPIGTWDTSLLTDMSRLFEHVSDFNESIADWNTSSVTNMEFMFFGCTSFNQQLHTWNTSSVTNMNCMFAECDSFNQPLHMWDTSFGHRHGLYVFWMHLL